MVIIFFKNIPPFMQGAKHPAEIRNKYYTLSGLHTPGESCIWSVARFTIDICPATGRFINIIGHILCCPRCKHVTGWNLTIVHTIAVCTIFGNSPMSRAIIAVATALIPDMGIAVTFHITGTVILFLTTFFCSIHIPSCSISKCPVSIMIVVCKHTHCAKTACHNCNCRNSC